MLIDPEDIDLDLRFMVWGGVLQDDGSSRSIPSLVNPTMVHCGRGESTFGRAPTGCSGCR